MAMFTSDVHTNQVQQAWVNLYGLAEGVGWNATKNRRRWN